MSRWFWPSTANNGASQTGLGNLFLGFGRTELIKEGQARPNSLRALLFYSPYNFPNFRFSNSLADLAGESKARPGLAKKRFA